MSYPSDVDIPMMTADDDVVDVTGRS
ncbi:MAG: hypothetical protein J07HX64_03048 [halophilic archaeon J07HX64]|nr:MAG: hypothetical protein J07HX64_03048 [halophilic archaeon J07HX64]